MNNLLTGLLLLTMSSLPRAQESEPAPPPDAAPRLVSMSSWIGQKLHVREPLRGEVGPPTDILRPVAIVDDLEIDARGGVTTFVLRRFTAEPGEAANQRRMAVGAGDVAWSSTENALVTGLAASAVAGLGEWQPKQSPESGAATAVLATSLLSVERLPGVEHDVRLPREGIWIDPAAKCVLWLTVRTEATEATEGRARLVPWAACTLVRAPGFLRLREPARLAGAPCLEASTRPPSRDQQVEAAAHFGVKMPPPGRGGGSGQDGG